VRLRSEWRVAGPGVARGRFLLSKGVELADGTDDEEALPDSRLDTGEPERAEDKDERGALAVPKEGGDADTMERSVRGEAAGNPVPNDEALVGSASAGLAPVCVTPRGEGEVSGGGQPLVGDERLVLGTVRRENGELASGDALENDLLDAEDALEALVLTTVDEVCARALRFTASDEYIVL
jgi:hypothetical protein